MNKLSFLCFLLFLLLPLTSADKGYCPERLDILGRTKVQDEGDGDEFELTGFPYWKRSDHWNKVLVNVDAFGAVGDGETDDTQAFVDAWKQTCSTPRTVFFVPKERSYLVNATRFKGPCAGKLTIQIDGTIVAPDDPKAWNPKYPRTWLRFDSISDVTFQGNGVIDGSGSKWWAASCKKNKSNVKQGCLGLLSRNCIPLLTSSVFSSLSLLSLCVPQPCKGAPTALTIDSSSAVRVKGLTVQNGQQMNFVISRSDSVCMKGVAVSAPENSPNTDGLHITESTNIVLQNCKIGTGLHFLEKNPVFSS